MHFGYLDLSANFLKNNAFFPEIVAFSAIILL